MLPALKVERLAVSFLCRGVHVDAPPGFGHVTFWPCLVQGLQGDNVHDRHAQCDASAELKFTTSASRVSRGAAMRGDRPTREPRARAIPTPCVSLDVNRHALASNEIYAHS